MISNPAPVTSFPRVSATRYVQPLREGGSLPAVVERVVVSDPKTLLIGEEHLATMPRDTLGAPNAV